ncbi:MAG: hypothetical protein EOM63_01975 [Clostridia bacterium]|nr:hypothetical protein [Clostridia bacterium]
MLKHLVKYEWKATSRILLPVFGGVLLLALINRLLWVGHGAQLSTVDGMAGLVQFLAMTAYILFMCAAFIITFVLLLQRFYKSLLGDEGYLMFTLPVTPAQNIWAKTIIATIMTVLSGVAGVLSVLIMASNAQFWAQCSQIFGEGFRMLFSNAHFPIFALEGVLLFIMSTLASILFLYLCIAIGHLAKRHRVAAALGAYFGLSLIGQWLLGVTLFTSGDSGMFHWLGNLNLQPIPAVHLILWLLIVFTTICTAVAFYFTRYILTRRLNLE